MGIFWKTRVTGVRRDNAGAVRYLYRIAGRVFGVGEFQAFDLVYYPKFQPILFYGGLEGAYVDHAKDDFHGSSTFLRDARFVQGDGASA
jgi:hypothetical protein